MVIFSCISHNPRQFVIDNIFPKKSIEANLHQKETFIFNMLKTYQKEILRRTWFILSFRKTLKECVVAASIFRLSKFHHFSSIEITLKKYVEISWNLVLDVLVLCQHQVDVEFTCYVNWVVIFLRIYFNTLRMFLQPCTNNVFAILKNNNNFICWTCIIAE